MTKRQNETRLRLKGEANALRLYNVADALERCDFRAAVDWIAEAFERHSMAQSKFAPAIDRLYDKIAKLKAVL